MLHPRQIVIIDNLSKNVRLEPSKNKKVEPAIRKMKNFVLDFGTSEKIKSGKVFLQVRSLKLNILISTRNAQANGQVERVNRTMIRVIQAYMENPEQGDLDKNIKKIDQYLKESVNNSF